MTTESAHHDDVLHRFLIEGAGVRGVLVRLQAAWQPILAAADYPPEVARTLGEATAAVALFGGHTKVEGRLSLQLRAGGALRTVYAEYRQPGLLRGLALWDGDIPGPLTPRRYGDNALLALTVETLTPGQAEPVRYQGLVGLDADTLAQACEGYFERSEQLPTRLILACRGERVAGLLLQVLPGQSPDADAWTRVQALLDTLGEDELFGIPAERLLYRLFHEDGVRLLAEQPIRFSCTCSRERVGEVLRSIGPDEAQAAVQENGLASVTCEFCGHRYDFDRVDIGHLFAEPTPPAPTTPQ